MRMRMVEIPMLLTALIRVMRRRSEIEGWRSDGGENGLRRQSTIHKCGSLHDQSATCVPIVVDNAHECLKLGSTKII